MKLKILVYFVFRVLGMTHTGDEPRADMFLSDRLLAIALVFLAGGTACAAVPFVNGQWLWLLGAAAGLLLGWQNMILSVLLGSVSGAVIHSIRMKHGAGHKLAFGPYLAAGIWFSALVGQPLIDAYLGLFGL